MNRTGRVCLGWWLAVGLTLASVCPVHAQSDRTETAAADSAAAATNRLSQAQQAAAEQPPDTNTTSTLGTGFLLSITNRPKAGLRANVREYTYYSELETALTLARAATFTNKVEWSYADSRKQEKTVENRKANFNYNFGQQTPLTTSLRGSWDWKEDRTTNSAGTFNLNKIDRKSMSLTASKSKFEMAGLTNTFKLGASADDQASENLGKSNDLQEGTLYAGLQSGLAIAEGITLAGRVYGTATAGDRLLGQETKPSSAQGDSVGVGVYYDRNFGTGRVALSRSNFERKYLQYNIGANGLVDTSVNVVDKVVDELETKDALTLDFEHKFRLGRLGVQTKASRTTSDLDYVVSGVGLKEQLADQVDWTTTYAVGRDSLAAAYTFTWRWDDQRIKGATTFRGRQYTKDRDIKLNWYRDIFDLTRFNLQYHQGLVQDIAQNEFNKNDKDRLTTDVTAQLDRSWPGKLRTRAVFSFRQTKDLSIRGTKSSNNNIKDSYEVTPSYGWTVAPWLSLDQNFRLYIQYTDNIYSALESIGRSDNYNKRGNLTTKVTLKPSERLDVIVRHDYNKRFNATASSVDAAGNTFYSRDLNQTISTIDLDVKFRVADGIRLETATYHTRDDKTSFGRSTNESRNNSGEIMVGAMVDRTWGTTRPMQLSAVIKKYNAFGPSVTATSADYWEADVWLKWEF